MVEEFKVNFKSHIKNGWSILFLVLFLVLFTYFMVIKTGDNVMIFVMISIGLFILFCLPAIIIHINYYLVNKGYSLSYRHIEGEIVVSHKNQEDIFNINDINRIDRFMSYNLAANRPGFLPWDDYNHSNIYLKSGKKITITSLLVPNLNLPILAEKISTKQSFFRLAKR